ncbi:hypothetical protein PFLUV_G00090740 [Perca fluviatilis]|uniref:Integrase zinc-binding domain-containing protein n=1 Tax=Perca fluviatilis TaxID=8168 RepID=A0A6A5FF54_PERFL|nr:hypothetical protein PFLUV_G00090740 [Perca fluviatilis]
MDPKIVREVLDLKLHNKYPKGLSSKERRAETFRIKRVKKKISHSTWQKLYLTAEEANYIFEEFHCSQIGGHSGTEKPHSAIISRYYWPGMEEEIRKRVAQCRQCQSKRAHIKEKTQYNPIAVSEPLELVGMDLVGKVTLTDGGIQYICVMIISPNGQKPTHSKAKPQLRSLNKVVADHPKDWDQYLQSTVFALRTKKQVTDDKVNYAMLLCVEETSEGVRKRDAVYEKVKRNVQKSQDREGCKETLWSKAGPYKVDSEKIMDLAPGKELETEVANAYLCMWTVERGASIIDVYTMTQIMYLKEKRSLYVDPFGATQQQMDHCRDVTRAPGPETLSGYREMDMLHGCPSQTAGHNIMWSVCVQDDLSLAVWGLWGGELGGLTLMTG